MTELVLQHNPSEANAAATIGNQRFYIIVPEAVEGSQYHLMEAGRLMAQNFHLGRVVESRRARAGAEHEDITAIVLSVRNSKELTKVLGELVSKQMADNREGKTPFPVSLYRDYNPQVYLTDSRTLTAVCVGPVEKSEVDLILGHLELY